jgi:sarcosine oxidase subunit gamma
MVDGLPRQNPLAHLGLGRNPVSEPGQAGVHLGLLPPRAAVNLRGEATSELRSIVAELAGCGLPLRPLDTAAKGSMAALWLGPDEWLITGPTDSVVLTAKLQRAFRGKFVTATDVSHAFAVIRLAGPNAGDVLSKGCGLDLHPRVFKPGNVAGTLLARTHVVLHQVEASAYHLYVRRSYADTLWRWLEDAGREFGVAVMDAQAGRM